jgi:hypothetical protein
MRKRESGEGQAGQANDNAGGQDKGAPTKKGRVSRADRARQVADLLSSQDDDQGKAGSGQGDAGNKAKDDQSGQGEGDQAGQGDQGKAKGGQGDAGDQGKAKGGQDAGASGQGDQDKAKAPPKSWKEAGERLGLTPEQLYGLQIDLAGEKGQMTLGQVKDFLQQHGTEAADISALLGSARESDAKARETTEAITAEANQVRRDLVGVMATLKGVEPATLEAIRQAQERRGQKELALAIAAAPEWKDPRVFAADKQGISAMLSKYGFSSSELDLVDDSRLWLFLRDQLRARQAAARGLAKQGGESAAEANARPHPAARGSLTRSQAAQHQARANAARAGGRASKVAAVAALLTSKG